MSNSFDFEEFKAQAIEKLKAGVPLSGKDGVLAPLLENLLNSALEGEMDSHLDEVEREMGNRRNGHMSKQVQTSMGEITINTPRDRDGTFDPKVMRKREKIFADRIIGLYAIGNRISAETINNITDRVLPEKQNRRVQDIFIACVDGLKGFPDAIASVFPQTTVQLCIVHQIRNSVKYVSSRNQKEFMWDLKLVYQAVNKDAAEKALDDLEIKWGEDYP